MNCYNHERASAVGLCAVCQKAVCRECVARDAPRLVCRTCVDQRAMFGYEYRSQANVAGWPLVHVCLGIDPATLRPRGGDWVRLRGWRSGDRAGGPRRAPLRSRRT